MRRRDLLAGASAAYLSLTSGCLGDETADDASDETADDTAENGAAGAVECEPVEDYDTLSAYPREDEPPHTIFRPESDDGTIEAPDGWSNDYLGECMRVEPSLSSSLLDGTGPPPLRPIADRPHPSRLDFDDGSRQFWAALVSDAAEREELFDLEEAESDWRGEIEDVDLDDSAIVVVESGLRSGERPDRWVRVQSRDDAVHLHGYVYSPWETTDDIATHFSVIAVDLAGGDPPERAFVSLTTGQDSRINFDSTEGVVTP